MRIYIMVCAILICCASHFAEGKMYLGSVTFKQKWADLRATPWSSQYNTMTRNIENAIRVELKNDSHIDNLSAIQLREDTATKRSTMEGNLAADFELSFTNDSRIQQSVYNLYSAVQAGKLGGIPVQEGSLVIRGLAKLMKGFTVPPPTPSKRKYNTVESQTITSLPRHWPSGSYGLPRARSGCPDAQWREGFRYQDSENVHNTNHQSNDSHLSGEVNAHGIRQEFCMHLDSRTKEEIPWPRGKYCIYKKGDTCPTGLREGWIKWDDENQGLDYPNSIGGEVPNGIYGENTVIYFCCSISGRKSASISLPYGAPFYLMAYGSPRCQQVRYYTVISEYVQFDDEDQVNQNTHSRVTPHGPAEDPYNTRIYYCYYQPVSCDASAGLECPRKAKLLEELPDKILPQKQSRASAFATGSGVGMLLIGSASIAVFAKRFLAIKRAHMER